jgi:pyruvate,orthophosphate dikinase
MEMVSGNQAGGGAAVFFTRNPYTLEQTVFGETRERASGDDLASGKTTGRPLSRVQTVVGKKSIEETDPRLYSLIEKTARTIEKAFGGLPQEVEVTYTKDRNGQYILSVLQTRRMEQGGTYYQKFDEICRMESQVIGQGIGAGGGALSGVASFGTSADDIERVKKKTGLPVILLRQTANTADVSLMPIIKGIVTASGGVTSHAAVLAQKFGISAVVACSDMIVSSDERGRTYAMIGTTRIEEGTPISLDGANGLVFSGLCFQKRAA